MHTLLGLSSLLLVVLGGSLALVSLRHLGGGSQRRTLQVLVLAAPIASLGLGIGALHHFSGRICFLAAPPWDATLGVALPLGMGVVALGGLGLGVVRLALMGWVVARSGLPAGREVQTLADRLAAGVGAARPRVLVCAYDRPLAFACGFIRPTVVLSTWMVEHLDQRELEAVLAHELGHVARRDYLVVWLATVLRDAFWYLPTSWAAYRQLQHEKEFACDDLAVRATQRPLALASALAKVWQHPVDRPHLGTAQQLVGTGGPIESRIERLLAAPAPVRSTPGSRAAALSIGAAVLIGLVTLEAAVVAVTLAPMGCGPVTALGGLVG